MLSGIRAVATVVAFLAASVVAQAQTFTWTGPSSFNDASQTFAPITANTLDLRSTSGATLIDGNLFGPVSFGINLVIDGTVTNVYSRTLSNSVVTVNSLPIITFATGAVSAIQFTSSPNTLANYNGFRPFLGFIGSTTFTFSNNTPVAVPGPIAGAGLPVLIGLAGVWLVRRRRQSLAA